MSDNSCGGVWDLDNLVGANKPGAGECEVNDQDGPDGDCHPQCLLLWLSLGPS